MPKDKFAPGASSKPSSYADYPGHGGRPVVGAAKEILNLDVPSYSDFLVGMSLGDQGQLLAMNNAVKYDMRPPLPSVDDAEPWEIGPVENATPPQELGMTDADAEAELESMQNAEKPKRPKKGRQGIKKPKGAKTSRK